MRFTNRKEFVSLIGLFVRLGFELLEYSSPLALYNELSRVLTGKNVISNCLCAITQQNDYIIITLTTKTYYKVVEVTLKYGKNDTGREI